MKKGLAFILAILVLTFSIIPCADEVSIAKGEVGEYSLLNSTSEDQTHNDACSPFCICTCCASFSVTCAATVLSAFVIHFEVRHSSFVEAETYTLALPIWQPPQLV